MPETGDICEYASQLPPDQITLSDRKRLLKRASRISPERIAEILAYADGSPSGYFLLGDDQEHYLACYWHETLGLMATIIEEDDLSCACKQHLLANGAKVFGLLD